MTFPLWENIKDLPRDVQTDVRLRDVTVLSKNSMVPVVEMLLEDADDSTIQKVERMLEKLKNKKK